MMRVKLPIPISRYNIIWDSDVSKLSVEVLIDEKLDMLLHFVSTDFIFPLRYRLILLEVTSFLIFSKFVTSAWLFFLRWVGTLSILFIM